MAKPAPRPAPDDDRPVRAAKPVRRARPVDVDDEYDDAPRKAGGGSKLPLILAAVGGFVVVGGGLGAYLAFSGGDKPQPVVQTTTTPVAPGANAAPAPPADDGQPAASKPPAKSTPVTPDTTAADPPKKPTPGLVAPLPPSTAPVSPTANSTAPPVKTDISPIDLERCKKAAVYIECEDTKGSKSSGSGWFGLEENLIFTNAHVIAMIAPGSPKPKKLEVFVNPGTPQQKVIPHGRIEILAVDRGMDLALLRVNNETGLPPPLSLRMSGSLRDLEKLVVLGYPGGKRLSANSRNSGAPAVTVNETKVMTLRRDDDGNLYTVQVSGGLVWGNSGGAIVDADGRVAAVAVRVDLQPGTNSPVLTGIAYGVPTEYVNRLRDGGTAEVEYGVPYKDGGNVKIPVTVNCLDPFNRLKTVGVACWVGEESKKHRPAGLTKPKPEDGDTDYTEVVLKYEHKGDKQQATGELVLPQASAGRVFWAQPFYANQVTERFWNAGTPLRLVTAPVDRVAANLSVKYRPGYQRPLTLVNKNSVIEFEEGEGADREDRALIVTTVKGREVQLSPPKGVADAAALFRMKFESVGISAEVGRLKIENIVPKEIKKTFAAGIKLCEGLAYASRTGEVFRTEADVRNPALAPNQRIFKEAIIDPVMESLREASVRLPNETVQPGATWKYVKQARLYIQFNPKNEAIEKKDKDDDEGRALALVQPPRTRPGLKVREYKYEEETTYKYVGLRSRQGVKEAVLEVKGVIRNAAGASDTTGASGRTKGYAFLDLETGTVVKAEVDRSFDVDVSADGLKRRLSVESTYVLDRGSPTAGSN